MLCPCCSGKRYADCCEPYHLGAPAPSALALMRSRYSAYALKKSEYIMNTTHPKSPYFEQDRNTWQKAVEQFSEETEFLKLDILGSGEDWVSFKAHLKQRGKPIFLQEKSRFIKEKERWFYLSGKANTTEGA